MANSDGLIESMITMGSSGLAKFKGGAFSLAFGNEIALIIDNIDECFILNEGEETFLEIKELIAEGKTKAELIKYWKEKSECCEISTWSGSFEELP